MYPILITCPTKRLTLRAELNKDCNFLALEWYVLRWKISTQCFLLMLQNKGHAKKHIGSCILTMLTLGPGIRFN